MERVWQVLMMSDAVSFYRKLSEVPSKELPIRGAFQSFFPKYAASHSVSSEQSKAARCISECKTGSLGYNISYCESCGIWIYMPVPAITGAVQTASPRRSRSGLWHVTQNSLRNVLIIISSLPSLLNWIIWFLKTRNCCITLCFPVLPIHCLHYAGIKSTWVLLRESSWFFTLRDSSLTSIRIFIAACRAVGLQNQVSSLNPTTKDFFFL